MFTGDHRRPDSRHSDPAITACFLWLVCSFGGMLCAQAPTIHDIQLNGNRSISDQKLLALIKSRPGSAYDAAVWQNDLRVILNYYAERGLIFTSIDSTHLRFSPNESRLTLTIFMSESALPVVDSLILDGNVTFSVAELQTMITTRQGRVFQSPELEEDIELILDRYEQAGYPFASIRVDRLTMGGDRAKPLVTVLLKIEENSRVHLQSWLVSGNRLTRPDVISREMRMPMPSWYDGLKIKKGIGRLNRMPFLSDVREGDLVRQNDSAWALRIIVSEAPSNFIDGALGYVPAQAGAGGYFAGFANMRFLNLLGTGRAAEGRWQKKDKYSAYFSLAYTEPWVAGWPVNVSVAADWLVQDTTYTDQGLGFTAEYPIDASWSVSTGLERRTVTPLDEVTAFVSGVSDAERWSWKIGVSYDTRDHLDNPSRGIYYHAGVDYQRKTERTFIPDINGPDSLPLPTGVIIGRNDRSVVAAQRLSTEIQTIVPLTTRLVVFNALHADWFRSPDALPDRSELIRLGGLRTLRGYPEDFFEASRAVWNNLEIRWLTSRRSRIFAFVDAGYYLKKLEDDGRIRTLTGRPLGYGIGLRFETKAGIMALDFGLGRNDAFSQTKVHVGLATQF